MIRYRFPYDADGAIWQEDKNAYVEGYYGRMVRYKGGSSTTTVQSYQPTEGEQRLSKLAADYSEAVAPNARYLNNMARGLIESSLGATQVDFNRLNNEAQGQINAATNGMAGLVGANNSATAAANQELGTASRKGQELAKRNAEQIGGLADLYGQATMNANKTLAGLARGELPAQYQKNMENSIASAMQNTMGNALTSLGDRGVLNSSVTTGAMNDIQRNAANTVAQQYQNNIQQAANLAQQQYSNANNLAGSLGNIYGTQYERLSGALGNSANLAQQQWSNAQNNTSQNSGIYSNLLNSAGSKIGTAAAAQEAAQAPAFNAWQASLGLNGSATNALSGISGKGTSTQTQTQRGGGAGFWGNFLGGVTGSIFCFPPDTRIKMADGTTKRLEHIEVGDEVMTYGAEGKETPEKVVNVMGEHYGDVYNLLCELGHVSATLTQPFLMEDGTYKTLAEIKMGDRVKDNGAVYGVVYSGNRPIHDIEVAGANTYSADGFIAKGGDRSTWGE